MGRPKKVKPEEVATPAVEPVEPPTAPEESVERTPEPVMEPEKPVEPPADSAQTSIPAEPEVPVVEDIESLMKQEQVVDGARNYLIKNTVKHDDMVYEKGKRYFLGEELAKLFKQSGCL